MRNRIVIAACVVLAALCVQSRADVDIEIANGQKVRGTIDPVSEKETLTLCIPGDSTLTVIAKDKKVKGGTPAPNVTFKVLDAGDTSSSTALGMRRSGTRSSAPASSAARPGSRDRAVMA